jgi:hypothetical protein
MVDLADFVAGRIVNRRAFDVLAGDQITALRRHSHRCLLKAYGTVFGSLSPVNKSSPRMFPAEAGGRLKKGENPILGGEALNYRRAVKPAI